MQPHHLLAPCSQTFSAANTYRDRGSRLAREAVSTCGCGRWLYSGGFPPSSGRQVPCHSSGAVFAKDGHEPAGEGHRPPTSPCLGRIKASTFRAPSALNAEVGFFDVQINRRPVKCVDLAWAWPRNTQRRDERQLEGGRIGKYCLQFCLGKHSPIHSAFTLCPLQSREALHDVRRDVFRVKCKRENRLCDFDRLCGCCFSTH